jgi:predicted nucleic acid-binding protein
MADQKGAWLLIDSNIWLEYLRGQERAAEVEDMLQRVSLAEMAMTEFTIGSIGLILTSNDLAPVFVRFVGDLLHENGVDRIFLTQWQMKGVVDAMDAFHLDFDDAYQYVAATSRSLQLVSFDTDFDRTDLGRLEPQDVLDQMG